MTDFFVEVNPMQMGYNEASLQSDITNDALRRFIESPEKYQYIGKGGGSDEIKSLLNKNELTELLFHIFSCITLCYFCI